MSDFKEDEQNNPLSSFQQGDKAKRLAERIMKRFQAGMDYKSSQGLYSLWAEYDDFWNADQWPEATAETEDLPRPVTNHFAKIIEQKIAAIIYEQNDIYYEPMEGNAVNDGEPAEGLEDADAAAARTLSDVAHYEYARLDMDELIEDACRDAATLCNGIFFFPWDNGIVGGGRRSRWKGAITGYTIDPTNFYPGDPESKDIQTQPWIIMTEHIPLATVKKRKEYNQAAVKSLAPKEDEDSTDRPYTQQSVEQDETGYVDLIHCFWKEEVEDDSADDAADTDTNTGAAGETPPADELPPEESIPTDEELMLATSPELLRDQPQKPKVNLNYAVVCNGVLLRHTEYLYKHGLYPFASFQWYPKRFSFFGKPESADIIANQKEENRLAAVALYAAYTSGVPDTEYSTKHIDKQSISGGVGGRLIANNDPSGAVNGVKIHQAAGSSAHIPQLRESVVSGMNDTSGVTEAFTGKAPSSDLNASAIIALQEAAGVRIRSIQRRFNRALVEVGKIWLAHWKEFCEEARLIRITGEQDDDSGWMWFKGTDYADMEFDVKVKSGTASPFNRSLYISLLDKMLEGQVIGPDEYLEFLPVDVFPRVSQLMQRRKEKQEEAQQMQLVQKITMMKAAIEQIITEARANGVPITAEAVQMMSQLVQQIAVEAAQAEGGEAPAGGAPDMSGGEMPGMPNLPNQAKLQGGMV